MVIDPDWRLGHSKCLDCYYLDHWTCFCEPPWRLTVVPKVRSPEGE